MVAAGDKLMLQSDVLVTDRLDFKARTIGTTRTADANAIPRAWLGIEREIVLEESSCVEKLSPATGR
jgi:hypothetical protein